MPDFPYTNRNKDENPFLVIYFRYFNQGQRLVTIHVLFDIISRWHFMYGDCHIPL